MREISVSGPVARRFKGAASGFAAVLLGAALLWGCSSGEKPGASPDNKTAAPVSGGIATADLKNGKAIYERYCHYCHGRGGFGDGPVGIAITPHPANFVEDEKRMGKTDQELFKSITEGIHKAIGGDAMAMPRWADILTEQERWDVLAYIRHLEQEGKRSLAAGKK